MLEKYSKKRNYKIGILGGTFDPPHKGHLYISKFAIKNIKLDELIWIVTKQNPLKGKPHINLKNRIRLSKKITSKEKKINVQYLDNKVGTVSTFNLLKYIKKNNLKKKLFFILGADNIKKFHKWNNWQKIPKIAKMVVFPREGYSSQAFSLKAKKKINKKEWIFIKSKKINISSSLIRKFW